EPRRQATLRAALREERARLAAPARGGRRSGRAVEARGAGLRERGAAAEVAGSRSRVLVRTPGRSAPVPTRTCSGPSEVRWSVRDPVGLLEPGLEGRQGLLAQEGHERELALGRGLLELVVETRVVGPRAGRVGALAG